VDGQESLAFLFFKICDACQEEKAKPEGEAASQPPAHAGIWAADGSDDGTASVELGGAASEAVAQLLDNHGQARRIASHHGGLGFMDRRPISVQHGA
jgi:hypothetical protein